MPSSQSIVAILATIANETIPVSVAWHATILVAVLALTFGWRPSRRMAGLLLVAPIVSASAVAFRYGNPFNGVVLGLLALALAVIASRSDPRPVQRGSGAFAVAGVIMLAFGWSYPHFLGDRPAALYLVAAPTGTIPCPTLSLVTGFSLLAGGLGSRAWSITLAVAGLFYGIVGVGPLGVRLDLLLVGGAITLLLVGFRPLGARPRVAAH